ncbi:MAG: SDR family NAD(P)-dependent oxidoreductase [Aquificae bacterium]|nr:SDR family NAD(P)-dependent oxidoreductase [Aquificota bacterium]
MELKGKKVLITGGARRIGKHIARRLAEEGADLVIHYLSSVSQAEALADELRKKGVSVFLVRADLEKEREVEEMAHTVIDRLGGVDVLINNASIYYRTDFFQSDVREMDRFYAVHVKAPFILSRILGKKMVEKKAGRIINIADYSGLRPYRDYTPYSVSKGAMLTLTRALAKELAPYVLVNAVLPGPIIPAEGLEDREKPLKKTVLKRWAGEEEVYKAVKYLIETEFTTGAFIPVEGGRLIC